MIKTVNYETKNLYDCSLARRNNQTKVTGSGWIAPNFDVKMDASNSEAHQRIDTHLDSGNANENPSACEPNDPALFINRHTDMSQVTL